MNNANLYQDITEHTFHEAEDLLQRAERHHEFAETRLAECIGALNLWSRCVEKLIRWIEIESDYKETQMRKKAEIDREKLYAIGEKIALVHRAYVKTLEPKSLTTRAKESANQPGNKELKMNNVIS